MKGVFAFMSDVSPVQTQTALQYSVEIMEEGRLELDVPFLAGERVTVFVIREPAEDFYDLLEASESSLDFWDNPYDDEDWNEA
jgi:hypothetical protein